MNKLDTKTRAQILHHLVKGCGMRDTAELVGVSKNTVTKMLVEAGEVCSDYQNEKLRDLPCKRVQVDEIWSFVYAKAKNVKAAKSAPQDAGDVWTWTSICADTKLVPSWHVADRSGDAAKEFISDLAGRLSNRVQLTSDGHRPYLEAVEEAFGADIDYAMLVKMYGNEGGKSPEKRYSPAKINGTRKTTIEGEPEEKHVSTSYVERNNLTMRMSMRRFTRLTNAFSKKVENHAHSISLHFMYYNFCRQHKSLKGISPAMAAGVTDRLWDIEDIVKLMDAAAPAPKKRGPYKKKGQEISN